MARLVNDAGQRLIKKFEGLRVKPYQDIAGFWTWGWDHKQQPGERIPIGLLQVEQCEFLFQRDLAVASAAVEKLVVEDLTDNQFAALASFVFNLGESRFAGSTLLKDIDDDNITDAILQFQRWVYSGGEIVAGLQARRLAEKQLFITP